MHEIKCILEVPPVDDFNYLDPYSVAPDLVDNPLAYSDQAYRLRRQRPRYDAQGQLIPSGPQFPKFQPEVADSLLGQVGRAAVGGLQYVAETLDKPGAAVRGLLTGRPDQLLNLIPFSDTLGITDPRERTSGRDLLQSYGLATRNVEGFHPFKNPTDAFWDVAGLGTEILTDPLTWVTGPARALTEAGQQAAKQGVLKAPGYLDALGNIAGRDTATLAREAGVTGRLAPTTASRIAAGQGGLAAITNPFTGNNLVFGTGPMSQGFAEKVLQPVANTITHNPITNSVRRTLSAGAGNASTELGQRIGQEISQPAMNRAEFQTAKIADPVLSTVEAEKLVGPHVERAMDLFATDALKQQELDALTRVASGMSSLDAEIGQNPKLAILFPTDQTGKRLIPNDVGAEIPKMIRAAEVGKTMNHAMNYYVPAFQQVGIDKNALADNFLAYLPRHVYDDPKEMNTIVTATMQPMSRLAQDFARVPFLKDIPLGREAINDMVRDVRISGPIRPGSIVDDADAIRTILNDYLGFPDEALARGTTWRDGKSNYDHALELFNWLRGLPADYADTGKDLFNAHPAVDFFLGVRSAERKMAQADNLLELVSRVAKPVQTSLDDVSVADIMPGLGPLGFDTSKGGLAASAIGAKINQQRGGNLGQVDLSGWFIPRQYADDIAGYIKAINSRDAHSGLLDAFDYWQNRFKGLTTVPWPSFHSRNLMSGMFYNMAARKLSQQSLSDAFSVMAGQPVTLRLPNGQILDTAKIRELAHGGGALRASNYVSELTQAPDIARPSVASTPQPLPVPTPDMTQAAPITGAAGQAPIQPGVVTSQVVPTSGTDLLFGRPARAFMETPESKLPANAGMVRSAIDSAERNVVGRALNAGGSIGQNVEDFNRLSHFIEALRQGYSPEEAALSVKRWQFDYRPEAYTWAERNVMKRMIPFFSFMKNNLQLVASELLENPGGFLGKSIRAANQPNTGEQQSFTPGYIREKTNIPLGSESNGARKYITSLGLPFEEPFERFQFGPTVGEGLRRTAESWLGTIRPEVKGLLEQLANRSFFFGRPLDKMYSMTGYQPFDQILMNTPVSRFVTAYRQAVDPRKTATDHLLNFGTGIHISDVPMDVARRDAEDALRTVLNQSPRIRSFENFYPNQAAGPLTPEEQILMRLYYTQAARKREAKQKAEARK
jgi:hypothetical protein